MNALQEKAKNLDKPFTDIDVEKGKKLNLEDPVTVKIEQGLEPKDGKGNTRWHHNSMHAHCDTQCK